MTKNSKGFLVISIIIAGALLLGYALFKVEPSSPAAGNGNKDQEGLGSLLNKPLPALELFDKDGKVFRTDGLKGKNTVLFFNEGIGCYPACWNQIAALGVDERFNSPDTAAFSVVADNPGDWQKAQTKMPDLTKAVILYDQNSAVSRQLGLVSLSSSMHKGTIPGHTYIVLDKQGIVRYVYDDPGMGINNDMLNRKIAEFKQ